MYPKYKWLLVLLIPGLIAFEFGVVLISSSLLVRIFGTFFVFLGLMINTVYLATRKK